MRNRRTPMQTLTETLTTEKRVAKAVVEADQILQGLTKEERDAAIAEIKAKWPNLWKPAPQRSLPGRRTRT